MADWKQSEEEKKICDRLDHLKKMKDKISDDLYCERRNKLYDELITLARLEFMDNVMRKRVDCMPTVSDKWTIMFHTDGDTEGEPDTVHYEDEDSKIDLFALAEWNIIHEVWDCCWIFPPRSDWGPDAKHPDQGNYYWSIERGPSRGSIESHHFDE